MGKKGYILVITILVLAVLLIFGIIFGRYYVQEKRLNQQNEFKIVAGSAAEAGIDAAIYQIKQNHSWNIGFSNVSLPNSKATYSLTFNASQNQIPYSYNNSTSPTAATGYGGRSVPPYSIHLISIGKYATQSKTEEAIISFANSNLFGNMGIIGHNFINMFSESGFNISVDAYDSSLTTYAGTTDHSGGNIGSYSVNYQNNQEGIYLDADNKPFNSPHGTININGTITTGYGADNSSTVVIPNATDVSYIGPLLNFPEDQPALTNPPAVTAGTENLDYSNGQTNTLAPGTYGDLNVFKAGTVLQLSAGKYVFNDLHVYNSGTILIPSTVTSPVEIYITGSFRINDKTDSKKGGGTIDNQSINAETGERNPSNLIIYGSATKPQNDNEAQSAQFELIDAGALYMAIYAPNNNILLQDTNYFGAMIGRKVDFNATKKNIAFHFDKALQNLNSSGGTSGNPIVKSRW